MKNIPKTYTIQIDGVDPDTFKWSDGGDFITGVPIKIPFWKFWKKVHVLKHK